MSMCTNHPLFYEMISDDLKVNNSPIYDVRVPISSERNLNFFLPVKESGVYYVTFSALSSKTPNNQKRNGDCSFTQGNNILGRADETRINGKDSIWFASAYIIIKKN